MQTQVGNFEGSEMDFGSRTGSHSEAKFFKRCARHACFHPWCRKVALAWPPDVRMWSQYGLGIASGCQNSHNTQPFYCCDTGDFGHDADFWHNGNFCMLRQWFCLASSGFCGRVHIYGRLLNQSNVSRETVKIGFSLFTVG